ncbi:uracil-DNA glycosylase [Acetobacterium wieringae]|uniref:Uracil-DNA glycosylase n=1 Tax=Acetobacterium wieringae TaxID=52694 RepID=A0ABY6HDY2_9FIRM|nr:uracil-DNA glycosylase family protein [Acetobacterium wieringae]UYO62735.1 uracil-DNA glycosylase [Acetobacterium wieringae]VUZ27760.1 Uncharacterised protein [Acetobacterium wieringae]
MNVRAELEKAVGVAENIQLNDIELDPLKIKTIMINEVVPADPSQDFYGQLDADYLTTTIPLFQKSGLPVKDIQDILHMGVYITNAVKTPKSDYTIEKNSIENSLPYLEKELSLFPNVKVIMLMGDVAKKAFNMLAKKTTKKNVIPAVASKCLKR